MEAVTDLMDVEQSPASVVQSCQVVLRIAQLSDCESIRDLIDVSINGFLSQVLSPELVEVSRGFMALDTQLVADGTYFIAEIDGVVVGSGGWSRRATGYGGDETPGRDDRLLDPATEPARIRAMYTHPGYGRRGIGRAILEASEAAARDEGFSKMVLTSTKSGIPLYRACGFQDIEMTDHGGAPILVMEKDI